MINGKKRFPTFFSILHESCYSYEASVNMSKHLFRLQPVHDLTQSVLEYKLLSSVNGHCDNFIGVFGNAATRFEISDPYDQLMLQSHSIVASYGQPINEEMLSKQSHTLPLNWSPWRHAVLKAFLIPPELKGSEMTELYGYAMSFVQKNQSGSLLSILKDLNQAIHDKFVYLPGSTTLRTSPYEVYVSRKGVCQDFANLFICLARLLNIPARYRVGYLFTGGEYENRPQGDATHAWVEAYLPDMGWIGFDPTNACRAGRNHIRVANGRNYRDATPTSGTIFNGGGGESLSASVKVKQLSPSEVQSMLL